MPQRKHSVTEEAMDLFIKNLALSGPECPRLAEQLRRLKPKMLRTAGQGHGGVTRAAGEFTLTQVIEKFRLKFEDSLVMNTHKWDIDASELDFTMTPCLTSLVENYCKNFDRSSEALCGTVLDFLLNECLTVTKGNQNNNDERVKTAAPYDNIRIYGEVSFNHQILATSNPKIGPKSLSKIKVTGRLDYGIGRILPDSGTDSETQHRRRFQSFLTIVEAKAQFAVTASIPQLLTYLACLRQSRQQRSRTDASVCGVASDGYQFIFVTITNDGTVKISKVLDVLRGHMLTVLGWLKHVLELTAAMSEETDADGRGQLQLHTCTRGF